MAQVIIKGSKKAIEEFCSWFSNSGEQGFMEAWADSGWNAKECKYDDVNTYIGTRGYGINEPIELVEYDKETDKEVFDGEQLSAMQLLVPNTGQTFNLKKAES
ncbi:hypothetical protein [Enterobacter phage ZX14]